MAAGEGRGADQVLGETIPWPTPRSASASRQVSQPGGRPASASASSRGGRVGCRRGRGGRDQPDTGTVTLVAPGHLGVGRRHRPGRRGRRWTRAATPSGTPVAASSRTTSEVSPAARRRRRRGRGRRRGTRRRHRGRGRRPAWCSTATTAVARSAPCVRCAERGHQPEPVERRHRVAPARSAPTGDDAALRVGDQVDRDAGVGGRDVLDEIGEPAAATRRSPWVAAVS